MTLRVRFFVSSIRAISRSLLRVRLSKQQLWLLLFSLAIGAVITLFVSYKAFGFERGMSGTEMVDAIKATPDYLAVFFVNILVGVSVMLLILELRWGALRVILTVGVALLFGYLMTAFFNLDSADRLMRGEFRVKIISNAESPLDLRYNEEREAIFNNPDDVEPITQTAYTFVGGAGNEITLLAYALDKASGLDMQVSLIGPDGEVLVIATDADRRMQRQYGDYITNELDAAIKDFVLPADGAYTVVASPETNPDIQAAFGVIVISDDKPPVELAYNGAGVGAIFNVENATVPLTKAEYSFIGGAGDVITVLGYMFRANEEADLQIALIAPDGQEIGANKDANEAQVDEFAPDLKSTRDAVIQNITLPVDGVYTVRIQPEPVNTSTRINEMIKATNKAYDAFLLGPLSRLNRWLIWIRDAITLIMLGLAIVIVFRAEQFSLGAEGQLFLGALVSAVIGLSFGNLPPGLLIPVALVSAATVGFLWGLLPGVLKAYLGANELVSTLMLNTIAQRFYEMVLTHQLQPPNAGNTVSEWIPKNGLLPAIIDVRGDQITVALFIAIAMVIFTWLLIQRTPIGYEVRMIGANIKFADYGGINTKRTIMLAMAISGAVAGLSGAHLSTGVYRRLILNISIGLAFEGVVVALLARNNPLVAPFTGLLYAYLRTGSQVMERDANISAEIVRIIQAVVILMITAEALVAFFQQRRVRRRGTIDVDTEGGNHDQGGTLTPAEEGAHG